MYSRGGGGRVNFVSNFSWEQLLPGKAFKMYVLFLTVENTFYLRIEVISQLN
jgi:hypothetical protein